VPGEQALQSLLADTQSLASRLLAQATSTSWAEVAAEPKPSLARVGGFVRDVAWLLWQKSLALLPRPQPVIEEREAPPLDLAVLREQMTALRQAAVWLGRREQAGLRSYARQSTISPQPPGVDESLVDITPEALGRAYILMLARQRPIPVLVARDPFPLTRMLDQLRSTLASRPSLSFRALLARCQSKREQVAAFLALLELAKQGEVSAEQNELWGDIALRRR
jgi:chromatin segregation and condensation protein Rec8/ScpA/Scc1 (kleisin family)